MSQTATPPSTPKSRSIAAPDSPTQRVALVFGSRLDIGHKSPKTIRVAMSPEQVARRFAPRTNTGGGGTSAPPLSQARTVKDDMSVVTSPRGLDTFSRHNMLDNNMLWSPPRARDQSGTLPATQQPSVPSYREVTSPKGRTPIVLPPKYGLIKMLGKGEFAHVVLAEHLATHGRVAIKVMRRSVLEKNKYIRENMGKELAVVRYIKHPNIARVLDYIETQQFIYVVQEWAQGAELYDVVNRKGGLEESIARRLMRQLLDAVRYCHQLGIVHRDLKTENIMVDERYNVKIVDFGLCCEFRYDKQLDCYCGSPAYASPELVSRSKYTGPEVDMWSLGVVLYAMVQGHLPFQHATLAGLYRKILGGTYFYSSTVSPGLVDLISLMLDSNPVTRITADEARMHEWLMVGYDGPMPPRVLDVRAPEEIDENVLEEIVDQQGTDRESLVRAVECCNLCEEAVAYFLVSNREQPYDRPITSGKVQPLLSRLLKDQYLAAQRARAASQTPLAQTTEDSSPKPTFESSMSEIYKESKNESQTTAWKSSRRKSIAITMHSELLRDMPDSLTMTTSLCAMDGMQDKAVDDDDLPVQVPPPHIINVTCQADHRPSLRFWWNITRVFKETNILDLQRALLSTLSTDPLLFSRLRLSMIAINRWTYQVAVFGTKTKLASVESETPSSSAPTFGSVQSGQMDQALGQAQSPYTYRYSSRVREWDISKAVIMRIEVCYKFGLLMEDCGLRTTRISGQKEHYHHYINTIVSRIENILKSR